MIKSITIKTYANWRNSKKINNNIFRVISILIMLSFWIHIFIDVNDTERIMITIPFMLLAFMGMPIISYVFFDDNYSIEKYYKYLEQQEIKVKELKEYKNSLSKKNEIINLE